MKLWPLALKYHKLEVSSSFRSKDMAFYYINVSFGVSSETNAFDSFKLVWTPNRSYLSNIFNSIEWAFIYMEIIINIQYSQKLLAPVHFEAVTSSFKVPQTRGF